MLACVNVCFLHDSSEGGFFNAIMSFPQDYPNNPPTVRFTTDVWHPNGMLYDVKSDFGLNVCIE